MTRPRQTPSARPEPRSGGPTPSRPISEEEFAREHTLRLQAEEANRVKDEFLATLGHELRTPLNAIVGWTHILERYDLGPADRARAVEVILRNARLQERIIDDVLDVARIMSEKLHLDIEPVLVEHVLDVALEGARPAAEAKQIVLTSTKDEDADRVLGDVHRLQQIVGNLLSNAVKFTEPGGRITVRARRDVARIVVEVADTGRGISADFLPYLFERFRQGDASITRQHRGLGLGLAIVRQLVELHGGAVLAASPGEGHGATFTVVLPRAVEPVRTVEERGPGTPSHERPLTGACVLVVDDEPDARELLTELLEQHGAEVTTAGSAREAFAVLRGRTPDVLVCDVGMPDEDGYAFIRRLRASGEDAGGWIPAIALTGYAGPESAREAVLSGFQMHVAKPLDPPELVLAITRLWRRGGRRKE